MRTHILKIKEPYFSDVLNKIKTFEIRKDDRGYEVGDKLILKLYPYIKTDIKEEIYASIIYKLDKIPQYGLAEGYCILGIKPLSYSIDDKITTFTDSRE